MRLLRANQKWYIGLVGLLLLSFTGCTAVDEGDDSTPGTPGASVLAIFSDTLSINSNGEDVAVITATVLDDNNGALEGVTVLFSTDSGQLSRSTATTDGSGNASVELSSGNIDRSNRNITVTADVIGVDDDSTIVQVTGTTVLATLDGTGLDPTSTQTVTLTVTVNDANGQPIADTDVQVSINDALSSGSGSVSPRSSQGTTNSNGTYTLDLSAGNPGTVVLDVEAAGVTVQTDEITISGDAFRITAPAADARSMSTNDSLTISVNAPGLTRVRFSTSLGELDGTPFNIDKAVSGGTASAVLTSDTAGIATVQVAEYDDLEPSETIQIGVAAPAADAYFISLQGSASVVALSEGSVQNSIALTATVTNQTGEPVAGSIVQFSLQGAPAGGEFLNPTMAISNDQGNATTTFTSGSISSDDDVIISAEVLNSSQPTNPSDTFAVAIGGTAGSIMIGTGTTIFSVDSDTAYSQPMVVVVADANGNPVEGAQVSLSAWPVEYWDGYWQEVADEWEIVYLASALNEDINENVRLDSGEDVFNIANACVPLGRALPRLSSGGNGDGLLTPANSAAGTLDATVTTDEYGKGQFNLVYAKDSADWVVTRVSATTTVLGSETRAQIIFTLPHLVSDEGNLSNSQYDLSSIYTVAGACP